jgi:hypothetical protein
MKKKQGFKTGLVMAALGLMALSKPVLAKDDVCADDKTKFCSDVDASDRKAMMGCLKQHQDDLSDACKQRMSKRHKKPSGDSANSSTTPAPAGGSTTPSGSGTPAGN